MRMFLNTSNGRLVLPAHDAIGDLPHKAIVDLLSRRFGRLPRHDADWRLRKAGWRLAGERRSTDQQGNDEWLTHEKGSSSSNRLVDRFPL